MINNENSIIRGDSAGQAPLEVAGARRSVLSPPLTGQIMILAVLALGGTVLAATTIAGFLMVYQIRQSTDLSHSAEAILAADAGAECILYDRFATSSAAAPCPGAQTLANGASFVSECFDDAFASWACSSATSTQALSHGLSLDDRRNFQLFFGSSNAIFP